MKSNQDKQKFIELLAKGLSFSKISEQIDISKQTLIKWSEEFKEDIQNLQFFEAEALIEQYRLMKIERIHTFSSLLEKAKSELTTRDLSDVPTKHLISILISLQKQLKEELGDIRYHTGEVESMYDFSLDITEEKTIPVPY